MSSTAAPQPPPSTVLRGDRGDRGDRPYRPPVLDPSMTASRRLLGLAASDRFWGWLAPLIVTAVGGFLRFWHLDRPRSLVFDETYYVKEGVSLLRYGYEMATKPELKKPDELWNAGNTDVFGTVPSFVAHPPLGKWVIGAGEQLFGVANPFGWRFSVALLGTVAILMVGRIGRRLFGSTLLGTVAALLFALDGQAFVHARTGLLDGIVMFFALAGFGCVLLDRDQARRRLAARVTTRGATGYGPGLGLRWWRLAAGVSLGACAATKWSGVFFLATFGLLSVLWDVAARRATGTRHWLATGLFRDGISGFVHLVPAALMTYVASWTGWLTSTGGYNRQWAQSHPSASFGWIPDPLRSLWNYHQQMWGFNTTLRSPHDYQSNPWSWIVQSRTTSYYVQNYKSGERGCTFESCTRVVTAFGNPIIWWGGTIALAVVLVVWALGRDWRAGALLAGLAAGYLPWFLYQERTIFTFYAVAFAPYVVLALTFALGLLLGPPTATAGRRLHGALAAGAVVTLAVVAFAWFYPVWAAVMLPNSGWVNRMWLPTWI